MLFILFFWKVYFEANFKIWILKILKFWIVKRWLPIFLRQGLDIYSPSARLLLLYCFASRWTNLGELSSCPGIFPKWLAGIAAAIWAIWVSIILLKLYWFFIEEDKFSSFVFIFSIILSLNINFLVIFSLILAWPKTRSFKEGLFELKFELKFELPPCGRVWLFHLLLLPC